MRILSKERRAIVSNMFQGLKPPSLRGEPPNPSNEVIEEIELVKLRAFENQPFKPLPEDEMNDLIESIKQLGIINPIAVKPTESGNYKILSGHNRVEACKRLGYDKIKAIIKNVNDFESILIVTDSNLKQRKAILPSEKAKAYKMQIDVYRAQRINNAFTKVIEEAEKHSDNEEQDLLTKLSNDYGESRSNVYRYLRLIYLTNELLELVDIKQISVYFGYTISYLTKKTQQFIKDYFYSDNPQNILTLNFLKELKELENKEIHITEEYFEELICKRKKNKSFGKVDIPAKKIKELNLVFETKEEATDFFLKSAKYYIENHDTY